MNATPDPITSVTDLLDTDREPTFDELFEEAWLDQVRAIAAKAAAIAERASRVDEAA